MEKRQNEFLEWYEMHSTEEFDFEALSKEYCLNDCKVLALAVQKFRLTGNNFFKIFVSRIL